MKKRLVRLIVAAACGVLAIFNPAPAQASPSIVLLKTSGAAGLANIATGSGFTAGEVVVLAYNTVPLGSAPAAVNGGQVLVLIPFNTPTNNPTGIYNVSLTGQSSDIASTTFNQNAPLVTLAQSSGLIGSVNTVMGNGFAAGETVSAAYNGVPVGSSVTADSRGTAVVTFDIPASNPAGDYNVSLTGHTSSLTASALFVQNPAIVLASITGPPGLTNIATSYGFLAGETVSLFYNNETVGATNADANGKVVSAFITPSNNPTGIYNVSVAGQTSLLTNTAAFNQNAPLVTLAQGSGLPGSVNTVTGNGFAAGETVSAAYNGVPVGSSVTADSRGTAVVTFDIPASTPAGNYNVSLTGHTSSLTASALFVLTPTIVLASITGPPGLTNIATSYGFLAGETVSLFYNNETVGATNADANGKVVLAFITPSNNPDGFYIVSVAGQTSLLTNTAAFNQNAALVTLAYAFGAAGVANTVTGFGFAANEQVDVLYNGVLLVTPFYADATGKVIANFTVPTEPVGIYPVHLAGEASGVTGTANFVEGAYLANQSEGSGAPGSVDDASSSVFVAYETVYLYYNGAFVTSVEADYTGTASAFFLIPTGNPSGTYPVLLRGASSGVDALSLFNQNATLVTLASTSGAPNSPNTATGYGYASGESVALSYDGVMLAQGVADSSGTVSKSFTTPATSPTGSYSVSLTGQTSGLIGSAAFFQFVPVVITSQPENAVAVPGQPVSVSVTASSSTPLTYQWVKDGMLLPGQTSSTLSFASFQLTNSGTYQVVVSNTAGIGLSVPALLSVTNSPLRAWGEDYYGELGDGNPNYSGVFLPELVATNVVAEAAGGEHSLYVTADGNLWAMGYNSNGQLGDGGFAEQNLPEKVWTNVVAVAAGSSHSLFVTADGNLWAMGNNTYGQLGDGSFNQTNRPVLVDSHVVAVAASGIYSLYVKADGTLWTMGYSDFGKGTLGVSPIISVNLPVLVAWNVVAVAAGGITPSISPPTAPSGPWAMITTASWATARTMELTSPRPWRPTWWRCLRAQTTPYM